MSLNVDFQGRQHLWEGHRVRLDDSVFVKMGKSRPGSQGNNDSLCGGETMKIVMHVDD